MPSARDAGVAALLVDHVLAARPDLQPALERVLAVPFAADPEHARARLDALDRQERVSVELAVAGGYYLHPDVRDRIGYPGQLARSVNALDYPEYLTEGLLDAVIERFVDREQRAERA